MVIALSKISTTERKDTWTVGKMMNSVLAHWKESKDIILAFI